MYPAFLRLTPLFIALLPIYAQAASIDTEQATELEQVNVDGKRRTSLNEGYTTLGTDTLLGLPMSLREIPQSISIITEQQLKDQNIHTLDKALLQATGVSQRVWGSKRAGYNTLYARGSEITNFWLDGVPINNAAKDTGNMNTSAYERVELIRGVSGLLDGSGEPGATVNLVRKRPKKEAAADIFANIGSRSHYGLGADVSTPLNANGSLRSRTVIAAEQSDGTRKRESEKATSLYSILEYDLSDKTQLSAGAHWQYAKEKTSASHTFSAYDDEGYGTHFGPKDNPSPNWSFSRNQSQNYFASIKHQFNDNWRGEIEYNYNRSNWYQPYGVAGILGVNHETNESNMIPGFWLRKPRTHSLNASIKGSYELLGRQHDLIVGVNGSQYRNEGDGGRGRPIPLNDVYDDDEIANIPKPDFNAMSKMPRDDRQKQYGGYVATRLYPTDKLSLILGARYSRVDYGNFSSKTQQIESVKNARLTPYAGMVYDINDTFSAYVSYSDLFVPQLYKDVQDAYLKPIIGSNLETGIKAAFFDNRLNASASIYQTRKNNMAIAAGRHADGDTYYRAADKTKTHGWEIDIGGEILPNWQIQTGYSQTITKDQDGKRLNTETTPKHSFKLFTSYQLPNSASAWTLGGGVRWQSVTYSMAVLGIVKNEAAKERALSHSRQKAYSVVDLMARYQISPKAQLSLNIDNLFNTEYRTQPDRRSFGDLRTVSATLRYQF